MTLISSGASLKALSQMPPPQMTVDLLEREWGSELLFLRAQNQRTVVWTRATCGCAAPAVLQPRSHPALAGVLPTNHAAGCSPGVQSCSDGLREGGKGCSVCPPGSPGPQKSPGSGRPDGVRTPQGCHSSPRCLLFRVSPQPLPSLPPPALTSSRLAAAVLDGGRRVLHLQGI